MKYLIIRFAFFIFFLSIVSCTDDFDLMSATSENHLLTEARGSEVLNFRKSGRADDDMINTAKKMLAKQLIIHSVRRFKSL